MNDNLETRFTYHPPKNDQTTRYEMIRSDAKKLAYLFDSLAPDGRELSLAITKLEEAVFWANAAIARGEA